MCMCVICVREREREREREIAIICLKMYSFKIIEHLKTFERVSEIN